MSGGLGGSVRSCWPNLNTERKPEEVENKDKQSRRNTEALSEHPGMELGKLKSM